ncbi:hypothetical protein TH61_15120 [Rufibacter sp. DG15C]|uniref:hypothetical protein n=1 Tax=Rufibacter sp. DG15C TaxID=1379909 RepID=UPI00078EEE6C|nr:hypothetical protein [Rufibacter sp. DG15C]AMM52256.1 hypothetical protein TH61_15120 [Rufibacter sp. DG15C]
MNRTLPTLLALGFFAGIFLLAFSTPDSVVATYRVIGFVAFACASGLVAIYWNRIRGINPSMGSTSMETMRRNKANLSRGIGNMNDQLSDKLKAMRQKRHRPVLFHH